jgi:uncharacterized protein DUF3761
MKWIINLLAALLLCLPITSGAAGHQAAASQTSTTERKECCHGCRSKYCNRKNCGSTCKQGPKCQGCWKDTCTTAALHPQPQTTSPTPTNCSSADYYVNTAGQCVHRPVQSQTTPQGATAQCRDGTYSFKPIQTRNVLASWWGSEMAVRNRRNSE